MRIMQGQGQGDDREEGELCGLIKTKDEGCMKESYGIPVNSKVLTNHNFKNDQEGLSYLALCYLTYSLQKLNKKFKNTSNLRKMIKEDPEVSKTNTSYFHYLFLSAISAWKDPTAEDTTQFSCKT